MPAWKRVIVSGSDATLTSVTATAGFTGSLFGTASFAQTASFVNPLNQSVTITGSLTQGQAGNIASGVGSHAEGNATQAYGIDSHAEGYATQASGDYSHAEGQGTQTVGNYSHAEGESTAANGQASHAEGNATVAAHYGYYIDSGLTAGIFQVGGDLTSIFTPGSFVLIDDLAGIINGTSSVIRAEVSSSIVDDSSPEPGNWYTEVALFDTTIDNNDNSVVIGISDNPQPTGTGLVYPIGNYSHAEGVSTTTIGFASHAEGYITTAQGYYSHAEGDSTQANGNGSHAEGYFTNANGHYSHAEGRGTVAQGNYQHVQGQYNITSSAQSAFIVGNGTADGARSNLIFASGSQVQITGSLIVSGSGTFTNIGPAVFSGSVASTAGFTGSLQGTASFAQTASFFAGTVVSASFAQTASFFAGTVVSASFAQTASFVAGTVGGSGTAGSIAKFLGTSTIENATADTDYLINSVSTIAYTAMGSTIKGNGVAVDKPHNMTGNGSLTAGTAFFIAYYLPKAATITGVKWWQGVVAAGSSGSFGLYSVSAGTITLQASSSFDTTVFSTGQNTFKSKAFNSTYAAPAGLYYIGVLSVGNTGNIGNISAYNAGIYRADMTNNNKVVASALNASSLPATQALSSINSPQSAFGLFLY